MPSLEKSRAFIGIFLITIRRTAFIKPESARSRGLNTCHGITVNPHCLYRGRTPVNAIKNMKPLRKRNFKSIKELHWSDYPVFVNISGGPFQTIEASRLDFWSFGQLECWNWGNNLPGANQGVRYHITRPVFQLLPL